MDSTCLWRLLSATLIAMVRKCEPAVVFGVSSMDPVMWSVCAHGGSWTSSCNWLVPWFLRRYLQRVGSRGLTVVLTVVLSMILARVASTDRVCVFQGLL